MLHRFHDRFGTAGVVIGVIALIVALGGTALAAGGLTSQQEKQVKKIAKKFAGKPGAPGANGANGSSGAKGDAGALGANGAPGAPGTSVVSSVAPKEAANCKEGGSKFIAGASTTYACNGTTGFTKTLPSKETETGVWGGSGPVVEEAGVIPISFPIPLPAASTAAFRLNKAETDAEAGTGGCTGTVENPTAPVGTLCLYTAEETTDNVIIFSSLVFNGATGYSPTGTMIRYESEGEGSLIVNGSFAVTAP